MEYKFGIIEKLKESDSELMNCVYEGLNIPADDEYSKVNAYERIKTFLSDLRDDLVVVVELEYIDKYFRDIYYSYYSSKLSDIYRNCVRISFFESVAGLDLQKVILHEMNVINPEAIKAHAEEMRIMTTFILSSCLGVKTEAVGFPHSSQDGEMMTCAETTVWGIMEYFGNRYSEYTPMFGSKIHKSLALSAFQRQLPSSGLSVQQISIALKEAGFGPKVYYSNGNPENVKEILSCYIESGIPVAVCIKNDNINHAIICVGHEKIDVSQIDKAPLEDIDGMTQLLIWNLNISKFIFNDDNQNPYEIADYYSPTEKYGDTEWKDAQISFLIVPLNRKIYLEANSAISLAKEIAVSLLKVRNNSVIRTFLASGRTYKEFLMFKSGVAPSIRKWYYKLDFPKFVWVTEISDIEVCKRGKFNGLLIFDATDPMTGIQNVLWAQYDGAYYMYDKQDMTEKHTKKNLLTSELNQFDLNLR